MFELTAVGVCIAVAGLIYMLVDGLRLLPRRGGEESLTEQYHIREYVSEVLVLPDSPFAGKTLGEADINRELDLSVIGIVRNKENRIAPSPSEKIEAGDLLLVEGKAADILRVKTETGLEIKPDFKLNDRVLEGGEVELFEVMVMRDSNLTGRTLKDLRFRQKYDLTVLAINRHGETIVDKISQSRLKFGECCSCRANAVWSKLSSATMIYCFSKNFRPTKCAPKSANGRLRRLVCF